VWQAMALRLACHCHMPVATSSPFDHCAALGLNPDYMCMSECFHDKRRLLPMRPADYTERVGA